MDYPQEAVSKEKKEAYDLEKSTITALTQATGGVEDVNLASLGLRGEAVRDIGLLAIIAAGWNICVSWAGISATLALSIMSGGSVTLLYGVIVIFVTVGCSALSLAEMSSVWPTAGGQYHWTNILAPKAWSRSLSYWCGSANLFGWIATSAGVAIIPPQLIAAIVISYDPSYVVERWHIFLMFQALNVSFTLYNIFLLKRAAWIHDVGFVIGLVGFFVIFITCLVRSPTKQSSEFVWATFQNNSGWSSDGVVFLTGLVNANYIYSGVDGAIHLAEECKNAARAVPQALMSTIIIGFVTSFAFVVGMVYSMQDFEAVLNTPTGVPIYELWIQATRSRGIATFFLVILISCGFFALIGCLQTASRLCYSLARDNGLVGAIYLCKIHPRLGVPMWALLANSAVVFAIGCVYLGSTTAFNAMIGTGLILQQLSYAFPAALLMYQRRASKYLPADRFFRLGNLFGWTANAVTVAFAFLVLVFFCFPTVMPVTAGNMNYASVVLGAMAIFATANWIGYARARYEGPRLPDELVVRE
ncbi:uncharacterized protein PV09_04635 [Verruconis gallopava]|uniref:Choline transport protein n=1 Tax=Verruconis gallopava TaxID=253628 RepID=A0A0D2AD15_9PEZI|nr:uncharacterized protein PV09_04635 [Verruconis gallopava]KIW04345.1 hypothetical protein PV09_04635 [Verruconis gallopava]